MVASASLNSSASKGTGTLSISTMLPRWKSPWQRRTQPALPRSISSGPGALERGDEALSDVGMAVGQRPRQLLDDGRHDAFSVAVRAAMGLS